MSKQIVFCPECRQDAKYSVKEKTESAELKGEVYEFTAQTAYCEQCGEEVYVAELEDANLKALYDVYRQKNEIISLEDIQAIPEKYNIGKRPLSLLLGWGEQTFSRYYDGDMPTKQYSEILKQIYADPAYYLSLLEKSKENLKSEKAYEKSKASTQRLLDIPVVEPQAKMDVVVDYLLSRCQDITPLSLQKALYYAQGFFYAFYRTYLFTEDCEAWVHGPAYPKIYRRYSNYCFDPIEGVDEVEASALSGEDQLLLDSIVKHVCCYSGKTLEAFTHTETPWVLARAGLPAEALSNRPVTKESIGEFFTLVKEKYRMLTPANIKDYTRDLFTQI
ncbi:phage-associated protein-like protein [Syntrophobotulus glycolicus DSM 8271]|uniref:Phage-associated protein-like protein n=1 Tax=Syntrophobotulus glycolicus (strain DSM 8271 / FlGlyR) TaxID=645991 RepID=F0SUL4_SYNGF|nr:type II TA system antitoxin MqsA family protein [Syntrophobotulus glycolicus]ADY55507.1 phage-associated protein-like protein [Syntrophobotulus glycolicus DSM 8271]